MLRQAWERQAEEWIAWARAPGHDSYWRFHRDAFLRLVPDPGRLTVDVGCGEGRLGRDLSARGHQVVGLDASPTLARAAAGRADRGGPVVLADAAALPVGSARADCVVAFMSFHDVDDLEGAVAEAARVLIPGGALVLAIVHPINSSGAFEAPDGEERGARPFVIRRSWFEVRHTAERVERDGYAMTFHSVHRPLEHYVCALDDAGFVIERLAEVTDPDPTDDWCRVPMFLHVRARLSWAGLG